MRGLPGAIDVERFTEARLSPSCLVFPRPDISPLAGPRVRDHRHGGCAALCKVRAPVRSLYSFSVANVSRAGTRRRTKRGRSSRALFAGGQRPTTYGVCRCAFARRPKPRYPPTPTPPDHAPTRPPAADGPREEGRAEARAPEAGQVQVHHPHRRLPAPAAREDVARDARLAREARAHGGQGATASP
jgi:hypothetical protein